MIHMNDLKFIEATNEGHPRVAGVAYGGGKISLGGWDYPIVVDLSGVTIPESVPLLANHDNRTASRIGMVSAMVNDNALERSFPNPRRPRISWHRPKREPIGNYRSEPM